MSVPMRDTNYTRIPNEIVRDGTLALAAKAVLLALISHAKDGECWPSHALLAHETGTSQSTVKRALRTLRQRGFVSIHTRQHGQKRRSHYLLDFRAIGSPVTPHEGSPMTYEQEPLEEEPLKVTSSAPSCDQEPGTGEREKGWNPWREDPPLTPIAAQIEPPQEEGPGVVDAGDAW